MARYVLRHLPGVAALERRLERMYDHPNPLWAPEYDGLREDVDALSRRLFGIGCSDTCNPEILPDDASDAEWDASDDKWDEQFALLTLDDDDEGPLIAQFAELGWDVCDEAGEVMLALAELGRQIIVVAKGLAGHQPDAPISDEDAKAQAKDWGSQLAAEAAKFHPKGRR